MSTSSRRHTDEATIRELVERWANAVRDKDVDGILSNHSTDMLMFDVPPPQSDRFSATTISIKQAMARKCRLGAAERTVSYESRRQGSLVH